MVDDNKRAIIAEHNDVFRKDGKGRGTIFVTSGIQDKGPDFLQAAIATTRGFANFSVGNDPYGEHDFGAFDLEGERLFFKIDYYDLDLVGHSADASDPQVTHRVLTIMLASEY